MAMASMIHRAGTAGALVAAALAVPLTLSLVAQSPSVPSGDALKALKFRYIGPEGNQQSSQTESPIRTPSSSTMGHLCPGWK